MKLASIIKTLSVLSMVSSIYAKSIDVENKLYKRDDDEEDKEEEHHHLLYEEESNAQYWASLDKENTLCTTGKTQSPINFINEPTAYGQEIGSPELKYSGLKVEQGEFWVNNGHSVQYQFDRKLYSDNLVMKRNELNWNLVQYHFHTPSEHHVNGKFYDTEVHFVHQTEDGQLHVVGFFGEVDDADKENPWLAQLFKNEPTTEEKPIVATIELPDLQAMIQDKDGLFNYTGSLTTPPCTESVSWLVAKHHFTLSMAQLRQLQNWMGFNARPTQINLNYHKVDLPNNFGLTANAVGSEENSAGLMTIKVSTLTTILFSLFTILYLF